MKEKKGKRERERNFIDRNERIEEEEENVTKKRERNMEEMGDKSK